MTIRPDQLVLDQAYRAIAPLVRGARRVLEVGCGNGELARRLAHDGSAVTAIDVDLRDATAAPGVKFIKTDFFAFAETGFDAVIFAASLHHIVPLQAVIDRAVLLLEPGGTLIADEFDLDAPGTATARWYYDTQELLAAADLYPAGRIDGTSEQDPRTRWLEAHVETPPLATGSEMLAAIASKFAIREALRGPYLYRYLCSGLTHDERGGRIAKHLLAAEKRGIADGTLDAVGLQVVAIAN